LLSAGLASFCGPPLLIPPDLDQHGIGVCRLPVMVFSLSALFAAGITLAGVAHGNPLDPIDGYDGPIEFGHAAINAPLDERGKDTYLGS